MGANMTVNERLAKVENQLEENNKTTWRVFEALYGNGKPGLLSEFRILRQSVEEHHMSVAALQKQARSDWKWIITTIVATSAVLVAIIK